MLKKKQSSSANIPKDIENIKGPILGYLGTISHRVDVELLQFISNKLPSISLVLIGDIHHKRVNISSLRDYKNIFFLGGKTYGEVGVEYQYYFNSTDDDGDKIVYIVDWGDESPLEYIGPVPSGVEVSANHSWNKSGIYSIAVKARDIYNIESDWSYLEVEMPRYRLSTNMPFWNLFTRFSNLFPIIKRLMQLL